MRRRSHRIRRRFGHMEQLPLLMGKTVTDVTGETRAVDKTWPDGSYNCPFCGSAASPEGCKNPACSAGEFALANPAAARPRYEEAKRRAAERKEEEARRQRDREWSENYRNEQLQEQARRRAEVEAEANRRGACVRCALEPLPYRAPKYIKHRGPCPKGRR